MAAGYDVNEVCEALASTLAGIEGLQESAYMLANPTTPFAEVQPGPIKYDKAFRRGLDDLKFIVRVLVGVTTDVGAQRRLYTMFQSTGADSVKAAIETDRTLGGLVDSLWVQECSGAKLFIREASSPGRPGSVSGPLLGAEWTVQILAQGA